MSTAPASPHVEGAARRRMRGLTVSPHTYLRITEISLVLLGLIVLTGAGVRLTGSGLGCPDWPRCYGRVVPPLETHAWLEFGNRLLSGVVGIAAAASGILAFRRRPLRWDLVAIGMTLPFGVVAQAVLGGFTVRHELDPRFVMAHFGLSMMILVMAVSLTWRARHEAGDRPRRHDALTVWGARSMVVLAGITILFGTVATAAGPHAGSAGTGEVVDRLSFRGSDTLDWAIHQHGALATALGIVVVALWFLARARGADRTLVRALAATAILLAAQGVIGAVQYLLELPAEVVWVHVLAATLTWVTALWAVLAAGRVRVTA